MRIEATPAQAKSRGCSHLQQQVREPRIRREASRVRPSIVQLVQGHKQPGASPSCGLPPKQRSSNPQIRVDARRGLLSSSNRSAARLRVACMWKTTAVARVVAVEGCSPFGNKKKHRRRYATSLHRWKCKTTVRSASRWRRRDTPRARTTTTTVSPSGGELRKRRATWRTASSIGRCLPGYVSPPTEDELCHGAKTRQRHRAEKWTCPATMLNLRG